MFGFPDTDYAWDLDDRKITFCYFFMIGAGGVSWSSRKKPISALSTTEAEFVEVTASACRAIWLTNILKERSFDQENTTPIYCDSSSNIKLSIDSVLRGKSKHNDFRYHFFCVTTQRRKWLNSFIVEIGSGC